MAPSSPIILSLLDEILLEILSRLSLNDLTSIPSVCRRFSDLLANNPSFLRLRLLPTLHVFGGSSIRDADRFLISVSVPLNTSNWSASIQQPLHFDRDYSFVSLGHSVYIIGDRVAFRHDTWSKTTLPIASPLFSPYSSKDACAINGKLYAYTSYNNTTIKEYNPLADEWRVVTSCPRLYHGYFAVGADGVFYFLDIERAGLMEGYDVCAEQWLGGMPVPLPVRDRVCGACGTPAGHLYLVSRVKEELRFWRWEGIGEEWMELEPPVVPQTPGYIGLRWVSFKCVAVRDERVVAMVNVAHSDINNPFFRGMFILVYNVADGRWSRGPDLPFGFNSELDLAFTEY